MIHLQDKSCSSTFASLFSHWTPYISDQRIFSFIGLHSASVLSSSVPSSWRRAMNWPDKVFSQSLASDLEHDSIPTRLIYYYRNAVLDFCHNHMPLMSKTRIIPWTLQLATGNWRAPCAKAPMGDQLWRCENVPYWTVTCLSKWTSHFGSLNLHTPRWHEEKIHWEKW